MLVIFGLYVLVLNVRLSRDIQHYCRAVAQEKGEEDLLESPIGGRDQGYNGYMEQVVEQLRGGAVDYVLSVELQEKGKEVAKTMNRTQQISAVFLVLLIISGFLLK